MRRRNQGHLISCLLGYYDFFMILAPSPSSFFSSSLNVGWHPRPIRPSGLVKASLTETNRQQMKQTFESHMKHKIDAVTRVSKPSPWHGGPIRPSGLLKASLTETKQQNMKLTVESNIKPKIYFITRVSKPSPWHGEPIRPSGLRKASLTEQDRQNMKQTVECNMKHEIYAVTRVSKPSYLANFSPSHLLTLLPSSFLRVPSCTFVANKNRAYFFVPSCIVRSPNCAPQAKSGTTHQSLFTPKIPGRS